MNNIRTKKRQVSNYIYVEVRGSQDTRFLNDMVDRINDLFDDHKSMSNCRAYLESEEEDCCILCGKKYEPMIEDGKEYCLNCGAGDKEYMLNKLEKSS